jgi:hypothetical protein
VSDEQSTQHKCFKCDKAVLGDDVEAGRAYFRDGYYVCPECLDEIKKGADRDDIDTLKSQLAAMTAELRNISQHLHYEQFSWLYVLGGGLQVLVLFILYRAHGAETADKLPLLMWAAVAQLMTVTAFIVGKLK